MNFPDNPLLGPLSRADFIVANQALVKAIIKQRFKSWGNADDTLSDGTIGLILAYDRYNDAAVPFSSFAFAYITGEIRNARSRRPSTGLRIPARLFPLVGRILRDDLAAESVEVVATELGISVRMAQRALHCARIAAVTALPAGDDRGLTDDYTRLDADVFIARLKPKPQRVIRMLMADYTQTEIAEEVGITRQAVNVMVSRVRADYERYEKISA